MTQALPNTPSKPSLADDPTPNGASIERGGDWRALGLDQGPLVAGEDLLLLLNFGGPRDLAEVEPFLFNLFNDPDCIPLGAGSYAQALFADLVSSRRSPRIREQYAQIGGRSPIVADTLAQAEALRAELARRGRHLPVRVAMRYTEPSIAEAVKAIAQARPRRVVALALYPHFSFATSGSSYTVLADAMAKAGLQDLPVRFVPAWPEAPGYVAALADTVRQALAKAPAGVQPHLLFSAHGLPTSFLKRRDPYPEQVQATVRAVVRALDWRGSYGLAYQSKVGPARWLSPATDAVLQSLGQAGQEAVVVVPISFVNEHIETLFELDLEYGHLAQEAGVKHFLRAPAVGQAPAFIGALADLAEAALAPGQARACIRCLLPKDEAHHARKSCLDCGMKTPRFLAKEASCGAFDAAAK